MYITIHPIAAWPQFQLKPFGYPLLNLETSKNLPSFSLNLSIHITQSHSSFLHSLSTFTHFIKHPTLMMVSGDLNLNEEDTKSYALSGKIMLSAIVILFFIVIIMICLHLYVRCFHVRARRRHRRRRRSHVVSHVLFYEDSAATAVVASARGLDSSLLMSLPVFVYSSKTHTEQVECPVCLSEFEEGETGRVLPKCNHSFHVDCIDMWFKTHSTCPTCRAAVEPASADANRPEVVIIVSEPEIPESGSTSGPCSECQHEGRDEIQSGHMVCSSSSSIELGQKPSSLVGVILEVPKRSESFGAESPSTQSPFRSPMSRMLSFKRMLSRDRKANLSPSAGTSTAGGSGSGSEIEKDGGGGEEETQ